MQGGNNNILRLFFATSALGKLNFPNKIAQFSLKCASFFMHQSVVVSVSKTNRKVQGIVQTSLSECDEA